MRARIVALTALALVAQTGLAAPSPDAAETARRLAAMRDDPVRLRMALQMMPKGADLHNHLAGAVYAEPMLAWAKADHDCFDTATQAITPGTSCNAQTAQPIGTTMAQEDDANRAVDALSMRGFVPQATDRTGHDHFFATFARFTQSYNAHQGDALAQALNQAARDHVLYLETMISPALGAAIGTGLHLPLQGMDFAAASKALDARLPDLVKQARSELDQIETRAHALLHCGTPDAQAGCSVTVHYLFQPLRTLPPNAVFTQLSLGYALAAQDARIVGVNFVAPEDDLVALRDYSLHMHMFRYLNGLYPSVKLSLHAGELTLGLVPPDALDDHIRQAVEIAGARRIGHGVDVAYERDAAGLLREMAARHVMVEINLSSNAQILGVSGATHPFMLYRRAGVPVALSTDDEGVSRIDLTQEYLRAFTTYPLDYPTLKALAYTGLIYGFEADQERQMLQARMDKAFTAFEHWVAHEPLFAQQ